MAVYPIRLLGDPVLRLKARRVTKIDESIRRLVQDMIESMYAAHGVGLAAPQIGVPLRVIVIGLPDEEPFALINPEIVKREGQRLVDEGCLSIPGYRAEVPRSLTVVARGMDLEGRTVRIKASAKRGDEREALLAQALEHEVDHINGILYIDRLESLDRLVKIGEGR
ncbi:MAG: peptide deformylase [Dehalococcoidia bacterium]|nr:peptide deformylase [Dehalococcoidia bacterium]